MTNTITTTIRWNATELDDIKKAAKCVDLPTSLFVKSIALAQVRNKKTYSDTLTRGILAAKKEAQTGNVDIFHSKKELIDDLRSYL